MDKEREDYPYRTSIYTYEVANLAVKLGKGEEFKAKIHIWETEKYKSEPFPDPSSLLFYVLNPSRHMVIDAGLVEEVYELDFVAEKTGEYLLVFDDRDGDCFVVIFHNSPAPLRAY